MILYVLLALTMDGILRDSLFQDDALSRTIQCANGIWVREGVSGSSGDAQRSVEVTTFSQDQQRVLQSEVRRATQSFARSLFG